MFSGYQRLAFRSICCSTCTDWGSAVWSGSSSTLHKGPCSISAQWRTSFWGDWGRLILIASYSSTAWLFASIKLTAIFLFRYWDAELISTFILATSDQTTHWVGSYLDTLLYSKLLLSFLHLEHAKWKWRGWMIHCTLQLSSTLPAFCG